MVSLRPADWRDLFCGREAESDALRAAYDAVAAGEGPRAVVVLGDRGMGKTRLVREFYAFLSRERDPDDYWPDGALFQGRNVLVGPDIERDPVVRAHFAGFALASRRMPFLWWGVRLSDPDERNAPVTDLATHRRFLDVHLEPLRQARRLAENRAAVADLGRDLARSGVMKAVEALPFIGQLASLTIEAALWSRKRGRIQEERQRMLERHRTEEVAHISRLRAEDVLGATLADLAAYFEWGDSTDAGQPDPASPVLERVPLVLFVDDAQFARPGGDEGVLELVLELWRRAVAGGWPLLLLVAHWEREWWDADSGDGGFASRSRPLLEGIDGWAPLALGREPRLEALVRAGLPGAPTADIALVLDQADGNPQLLLEIVERIRRSPAWRVAGGGLSPEGRRQLTTTSFDLHRLIRERMESETTPDEVRRAVAVSSVQGMEFSCALSEAVAALLRAGPVREGLEEAEERHRYVLGVDQGVASFLQRAYRQAALDLVGGQLGSTEVVDAALAHAADSFLDDESRWATLNEPERDAVLALRATLGEHSTDSAVRGRAAAAMGRLARRALLQDPAAQDVPRAARWGQRLAEGLEDGRFSPLELPPEDVELAAEAVRTWYGSGAAVPLLFAVFERERSEGKTETRSGAPELDWPGMLTDGLRAVGRFEEAAEVAREVVESARDAVRRDPTLANRMLLFRALRSEAWRLDKEESDIEAAIGIRHEQYELGRAMNESFPGDDGVLREWSQCAIQFAGALNRAGKGDLDLPLELLFPARRQLVDLVERIDNLDDAALVGHLDVELARTFLRRGVPGDADVCFGSAIDLFRAAYTAQPRFSYREGLFGALASAAEAAWNAGETERALGFLREAREVMEGLSPPPDVTHGFVQMKLYRRMVNWTIDGARRMGREPDLLGAELGDLLAAARALLPHVPLAAEIYGEIGGRVAGELWARAATDAPGGAAALDRADEMREDALTLLPDVERKWALFDWFQEGLVVIDEKVTAALATGDPSAAVLAVAGLRWTLGYHEAVGDDSSLTALHFWIVAAGQEVLEAGIRLEPELVRACARAAMEPWQAEEPSAELSWPRAPALAALAILGGDIPAAEREALARAAIAAFEEHPSRTGSVVGLEMEVELDLLEMDAVSLCGLLDSFAAAMRAQFGEEGIEKRAEWRWMERLRRRWGCGPAEGARSAPIMPDPTA